LLCLLFVFPVFFWIWVFLSKDYNLIPGYYISWYATIWCYIAVFCSLIYSQFDWRTICWFLCYGNFCIYSLHGGKLFLIRKFSPKQNWMNMSFISIVKIVLSYYFFDCPMSNLDIEIAKNYINFLVVLSATQSYS